MQYNKITLGYYSGVGYPLSYLIMITSEQKTSHEYLEDVGMAQA